MYFESFIERGRTIWRLLGQKNLKALINTLESRPRTLQEALLVNSSAGCAMLCIDDRLDDDRR
jgi:hypothetical protein